MSQDNANLGEQALDKAMEIGLSSQLDEVEEMHVDIKTDPLKVIQGEVDSVTIDGQGMVMEKDLRVEEVKVQTGNIAINPLSAAFGKIELKQPTDAATHVILTEQDINRAFNSEYLRDKLQNLDIQVEGQPMTINTEKVDFQLPGEGKIGLNADIVLSETSEKKQVAFTAVPQMSANGQRISLTEVNYTQGEELSPELTKALLDKTSELLDLRNFELEGMSLRLKGFDVEKGNLTLQAEAHVEEFPSS